jgi:hypothetical protein
MRVRRILVASTIVWLALGLPLLIYARPLMLLYMVKRKTRTASDLWIVPRPLLDISIEHSAGRKFTYYGYQFEAPWTELKQQKTSPSMELLYFSNGFVLMFHDPAQSVDQLKFLTSRGSGNEAELKDLFGKEATGSNYALRSRILNLTPRDLRLSFSRRKMMANSVLLMLKPIWTASLQGGLYSFQTESLRGFQHERQDSRYRCF